MAEFKLPERLTTLVLDEGDYAGVEATVRLGKNVGLFWRVQALMERPEDEAPAERDARLVEFYDIFANDILVSWNVADQRGPVPVTVEGIARVEPELLGEITFLWLTTTEQVPPPLAPPSPDIAHSGRRKGSPRRRS